MPFSLLQLLSVPFFTSLVFAHSWNEQLAAIGSGGKYVGAYGYPRGYMARTDPGFNGDSMDYLLPSLASGRLRINENDLICHPSQRSQNQTSGYPRLEVSPGTPIAMKYLENGHVTLPQNQPGKPPKGGTVFVFGTTSPRTDEKLAQVLQWNRDGTGGDSRGRLLAANNFDDERCHQINSGPISVQRQQEFPNPVPGQPGTKSELWCETDVVLPQDITPGELLTVYWVWQWPTSAGAPGVPYGKDEYYTTCSDLQIVASAPSGPVSNALVQQDPETHAVITYMSRAAITPAPQVKNGGSGGTLDTHKPIAHHRAPAPGQPAPQQPQSPQPKPKYPEQKPNFVPSSEVYAQPTTTTTLAAGQGRVMTALVTVVATIPPGQKALVVQGRHEVTFYAPEETPVPKGKRSVGIKEKRDKKATGGKARKERRYEREWRYAPSRPVVIPATQTGRTGTPSASYGV